MPLLFIKSPKFSILKALHSFAYIIIVFINIKFYFALILVNF